MTAALDRRVAAGVFQAPLRLAYNPVYRFYDGGALTRRLRGLPERADDRWSEDWVGACVSASNPDPDGRVQGPATVELPDGHRVLLEALVAAAPEESLGAAHLERWGATTGVLVKLLSPSGQVPLHAHPSRGWAGRHLGSAFGKTEAWIILDAPGDGREPAYAGLGFQPGIDRAEFRRAVARRDGQAIRSTLHRTEVEAGDVYVAHGGVPHYLGPRISFIEVQEPTDFIVIPETDGLDDAGATMGLGWDLALDMIDYEALDRPATFARARQAARLIRTSHGSTETDLFNRDLAPFFDAHRLDVSGELEIDDGRFSIAIVTGGAGELAGDFGSLAVRQGDAFAWAATLGLRVRSTSGPLTVVRCLGPAA